MKIKLEPDHLRKLGAALWFNIGVPLRVQDIYWVNKVIGKGADKIILESLRTAQVIEGDGVVNANALVSWLGRQCNNSYESVPKLVWTIPENQPSALNEWISYSQAIFQMINEANNQLLIVSPFLQFRGAEYLTETIIRALYRGVVVSIITHNLDSLSSEQSIAVDILRKEAERLSRSLTVYTTASTSLIHAKIVMADESKVLIGSANLTGPGLGLNFEAGVILGAREAYKVSEVIAHIIETNKVKKIFYTLA